MIKRIFVAVDISAEAKRQAVAYLENLREDFRNLRVGWERGEKLHINLKFLGDIDDEQLKNLQEAVEKTAEHISRFKIEMSGVGVFPNPKRARVLWLGVNDKDHNLLKMVELLEDECEKVGLSKDTKFFRPHITIARLREPEKSRKLVEKHLSAKIEPVEFEVAEITIYESRLLPTGSQYSKMKVVELKGEKV